MTLKYASKVNVFIPRRYYWKVLETKKQGLRSGKSLDHGEYTSKRVVGPPSLHFLLFPGPGMSSLVLLSCAHLPLPSGKPSRGLEAMSLSDLGLQHLKLSHNNPLSQVFVSDDSQPKQQFQDYELTAYISVYHVCAWSL